MAPEDAPESIDEARAWLDRQDDDEHRLEVLERLYQALERDLDQASATGR